MAAAIAHLQPEPLDVIVVVRGGGSKADLAAFDQEPVARAIATSDIPVWTGIGHTGDQSVADEVANRSFITPTECGQELARVATRLLAGRRGRRRGARPDRPATGCPRPTGARPPVSGPWPPVPATQLDRHADGLGHRARHPAHRGPQPARRPRRPAGGPGRVRWPPAAAGAEPDGRRRCSARPAGWPGCPTRRLEVEELRVVQRRRLLGAYDYQRQLERGYSVTRDASGAVLRSVAGLEPGLGPRHPAGRRRPSTRPSPAPTGTDRTDDTTDTTKGSS